MLAAEWVSPNPPRCGKMLYVLILRAGGFDIQLSRLYPDLKFVVQDRGPVLEQGEHTVWPKENPQALADGRVTFMQHDFFDVNPVKDADVYWLRYIMSVTPYNNRSCFPIRSHQTGPS